MLHVGKLSSLKVTSDGRNPAVLLLLLAIAFSGCVGLDKAGSMAALSANSSNVGKSSGSGMDAFRNGFFAFARQNCVDCHVASQQPFFSQSDITAAYAAAKTPKDIDLKNVDSSSYIIHSENGHCGRGSCSGMGATAKALLEQWSAAELAAQAGTTTPPPGGTPPPGPAAIAAFLSPPVAIPATIPTATSFIPLRFNLAQLTPANAMVSKALFEIEIQLLNFNTYHVRNPKLGGITTPVKLTGMHVYIKKSGDAGIGVEDTLQGDLWATDLVTAPIFALPATLPATPLAAASLDSRAMAIGTISSTDVLTIGFDKIEVGVVAQATFASVNANILVPKCIGCHTVGNAQGGVDLSSYAKVVGYVGSITPASTILYSSVTTSVPLMPQGGALSAAEKTAISNWIIGGALNN